MEPLKPKLPQRMVVTSKDVQELTGFTPRGSRNLILNIKRHLGKDSKDFLYVHELSKVLKIEEERVRSCMRTSLLFFIVWFATLIIFRDDLDLMFDLFLATLCLKFQFPRIQKFSKRLWVFLLHPDKITGKA